MMILVKLALYALSGSVIGYMAASAVTIMTSVPR